MISKVKSVYHIDRDQAKEHLRVEDDYKDDDRIIDRLIKAAHAIAETKIGKDIAKTTNVLTRYDFAGGIIRVNEGNLISITAISVKETETPLENFTTYVYRDYFKIVLDDYIDTDELTITFETGFDKDLCPWDIQQAILMKIADLYDIDRASSVISNMKETGAFDRLLTPYVSLIITNEREN